MAIKINGTNTAAAPGITGDDTDTGLVYGTNQIDFSTGGTSKATIDSSGKLGINTASPIGTLDVHDGTFCLTKPSSNSSSRNWRFLADNAAAGNLGLQVSTAAGGSTFSNVVEIDSVGGVRIGTTTHLTNNAGNSNLSVRNTSVGYACEFQTDNITGGYGQLVLNSTDGTSGQTSIYFQRSGSNVGSISTTASSTSFNTSSDYRLKENAVSISDGITRLKTLKPYRFNFIAESDKTVDGFFAHEVTAVPEAVTGTKDEVSTVEDGAIPKGDPIYQSIDQSKLVPLLTAALQEEISKREALETRIAALEG